MNFKILSIFKRRPKILIHNLEELEWFDNTNSIKECRVSILNLGGGYSLKIEDNYRDKNTSLRYTIWFKCRGRLIDDFNGVCFGLYSCRYKSEAVKYINYVYNQLKITV